MGSHWILLKDGRSFSGRRPGFIERMRRDNSWYEVAEGELLSAHNGIDELIEKRGTSDYDQPRPNLIGATIETPHGIKTVADAGVMGSGADGVHVTITCTDGTSYTHSEWTFPLK